MGLHPTSKSATVHYNKKREESFKMNFLTFFAVGMVAVVAFAAPAHHEDLSDRQRVEELSDRQRAEDLSDRQRVEELSDRRQSCMSRCVDNCQAEAEAEQVSVQSSRCLNTCLNRICGYKNGGR